LFIESSNMIFFDPGRNNVLSMSAISNPRIHPILVF
jgi:hypothetical protein